MKSTSELVLAAKNGEKDAFNELVRRYERVAIITAHAVLRDFHAAQDAAQSAFLIAYSKLDQLRNAETFGAWLLQIVQREAQHQPRFPVQTIDTSVASANTEQVLAWQEKYDEVARNLARLPDHERIVLVLRYVDGLSVQQVSDTTGSPVNTVTKQISRAVQRLRSWLKNRILL
jgi:RNA polymerase sigma-70 factor (ECF subfamily)